MLGTFAVRHLTQLSISFSPIAYRQLSLLIADWMLLNGYGLQEAKVEWAEKQPSGTAR